MSVAWMYFWSLVASFRRVQAGLPVHLLDNVHEGYKDLSVSRYLLPQCTMTETATTTTAAAARPAHDEENLSLDVCHSVMARPVGH
jgi:hypothetical protein